MRKVTALLAGLCIAILLGWLYVKFNGGPFKSAQPMPTAAPEAATKSTSSTWWLYAIVVFAWVTAFMSMPQWLAVILDFLLGWVAFALFVVSGVFVWMAQPGNTLQDQTYVAFLCSIAVLAVRAGRLLGVFSKSEDGWRG